LGRSCYVDWVFGRDSSMNTEQFYALWEKYSMSDIIQELPDDIEKFCEEHEITVDYFIEEFM
jgi:hypothetical protein